ALKAAAGVKVSCRRDKLPSGPAVLARPVSGICEEASAMRTWPVLSLGLLAALAACLLLAGSAGAYQFKDEEGKFSAQFPAQPVLDKREGQSATGPHVHYT